MKKIQNLISGIILLISSCTQSKQNFSNSENFTNIDLKSNLENKDQNFDFKSLFKIDKIIKLESNKDTYLSSIDKLIFEKDTIYILDKKYSSVRIFDSNGIFLNNIGKLGQGPGEFSKIFDIDTQKNFIYAYSNDDHKICKFSKNGAFISEKKIPFFAYYFLNIENENKLFFVNYNSSEYNDEHNLIKVDKDFKVQSKFFKYNRNFVASMSGFLSKTSHGILHSEAFTDEVFEYKGDSLSLKYKINLGEYQIRPEFTNDVNIFMKESLNYSFLRKNIADSPNNLFLSLIHDKNFYNVYYDKISKKSYVTNEFRRDDIFRLFSKISNIADNDNQFIAEINPENLSFAFKNAQIKQTISKEFPDLFKTLSLMKDTDNPILIIFSKK